RSRRRPARRTAADRCRARNPGRERAAGRTYEADRSGARRCAAPLGRVAGADALSVELLPASARRDDRICASAAATFGQTAAAQGARTAERGAARAIRAYA